MDLKSLEENVCDGFRHCIECRNSKKRREEFFRNGYVDEVDFTCPHGIPLSGEIQAKPVSSVPGVVFSEETKVAQEKMAKVPDAIRKLRSVVSGEAVEWLNTIVDAFFPKGFRIPCVYMQKSPQKLRTKFWGVVFRIYCCSPDHDSSKKFLIEPECTQEKCPFFRESAKIAENMKGLENV
jgi:hypothetical protein